MDTNINSTSRRQFLKTSSAAVVTGAMAAPFILSSDARAAGSSEKLKIGFIGCGGRGSGAVRQALKADSNVELYAMADVFPEKIASSLAQLQKLTKAEPPQIAPEKINCPPERQFVGLDAYKKVLDCGVDVVLLTTPPGFRPQQFKAAVEAGKHVFLEKPMATDAPGVRSVMESVKLAKAKKLAVVAGFCWRYDYARREFFKRILDGAVGELRALYGCYWSGPVKPMDSAEQRPAGMSDVEWQLRHWYNFVWTCGDGLVEQGCHTLDKVLWAMKDEPPLKCVAVGGRQVPNPGGNIYDHVEVNYVWPNGVRAFFGHRQLPKCPGIVADYVMGTKGVGTIGEQGQPLPQITGESKWIYDGPKNDMYQTEHDEFFASIRSGEPINNGERMATSTMAAIMGRMAAYTGAEVTWEKALASQERLVPETLDWNQELPVAPMAIPGTTKFS